MDMSSGRAAKHLNASVAEMEDTDISHELFSNEVAKYSAMDAKQLIVELHRALINRTFAELEE